MFGQSRKKQPTVDLDELITLFGQSLSEWDGQQHADILLRARFADYCRDRSTPPVANPVFSEAWHGLNEAGQHRLCILVAGLDADGVPSAFTDRCGKAKQASIPLELLTGLAHRLHLLTRDVLTNSDVRLEEFSRHFCAAWELDVEDEQSETSAQRLYEINFERLMSEADAARSSAEERLAYLRKLQEEEEKTRRPRRGKW